MQGCRQLRSAANCLVHTPRPFCNVMVRIATCILVVYVVPYPNVFQLVASLQCQQ